MKPENQSQKVKDSHQLENRRLHQHQHQQPNGGGTKSITSGEQTAFSSTNRLAEELDDFVDDWRHILHLAQFADFDAFTLDVPDLVQVDCDAALEGKSIATSLDEKRLGATFFVVPFFGAGFEHLLDVPVALLLPRSVAWTAAVEGHACQCPGGASDGSFVADHEHQSSVQAGGVGAGGGAVVVL
jgi:hypothetical protein